MDWGIVVSVLVAIALFVLAAMAIFGLLFLVLARGVKRQIEAGGTPRCPIPGCPFHKGMEGAQCAETSEE